MSDSETLFTERSNYEVSNNALYKVFETASNTQFRCCVTDTPVSLDARLQAAKKQCARSWDFGSGLCFGIKAPYDNGTSTDRYGEILETATVIELGTAMTCFKLPYMLSHLINKRGKELVEQWNIAYSDASKVGKRCNPSHEISLAKREWVTTGGRAHRTELVLILDTFRFTRDRQMEDKKVRHNNSDC